MNGQQKDTVSIKFIKNTSLFGILRKTLRFQETMGGAGCGIRTRAARWTTGLAGLPPARLGQPRNGNPTTFFVGFQLIPASDYHMDYFCLL